MADRTIFARALPEAVRITETYSYQQIIARNSVQDAVGKPKGELKVTVAYDGQRSFAREAWLDVRQQGLQETADGQEQQALIGHLAFSNTGRTRLGQVVDLRGQFNTVPIQVPVAHPMLEHLDHLVDGQHVWEAKIEYAVDEPATWPIKVGLAVQDEAGANPVFEEARIHSGSPADSDLIKAAIRHLVNPQALMLLMRVKVNLPVGVMGEDLQPEISKVRVNWPRFTSLSAFEVLNESKRDGDKRPNPLPHRFDAVNRALEWTKVAMSATGPATSTGMRNYDSPAMSLSIQVPTDLRIEYDEQRSPPNDTLSEALTGEVQVEVPGWLMSGLQVRLFDGAGRLVEQPPLHLKTVLKTSFTVNLDDALTRRVLTPRLQLFFDQVIPDDLRMLDIRTALADRGFQIYQDEPISLPERDFGHYLLAMRTEGSDKLIMLVVVEGKTYTTRREARIPGQQRYTSVFESGALRVHMIGVLPSDGRALIREMNRLQQALHARFDHVRANR